MRIEIDQSGKIENTNRPTVVAYSNKENGVLIILAKDKKSIQKYFRRIGKPKLFIYFTFIALVFCLISKHIKNRDQIVIDREYPGYERFITKTLYQWIEKHIKVKEITVATSQIGKKSRAHDLAWNELQLKSHKTTERISAEKLIRIIKTNLKSGSI